MIDKTEAEALLERIQDVSVAVCGDLALDAYWMLDPGGSEVSVETGRPAQAVNRHYYSPGGGANVVANAAVLEPKEVRAIGVVGEDVFGRELRSKLQALGADLSGLVTQQEDFDTVTFVKRYLRCKEQPRIDFGFRNRRTRQTDRRVLEHLERALWECDAVIFNQQVPGSLRNEGFLADVQTLFDEHETVVVLDTRHYGDRFEHVHRKLNAVEAARLCGAEQPVGAPVARRDATAYGRELSERSGKPVFMTRGERGMFVFEAGGLHPVPGIQHSREVDPVGAGDTVTATLALALGVGATPVEASELANLAAAVTVRKLFQTGTASPREILDLADTAERTPRPDAGR